MAYKYPQLHNQLTHAYSGYGGQQGLTATNLANPGTANGSLFGSVIWDEEDGKLALESPGFSGDRMQVNDGIDIDRPLTVSMWVKRVNSQQQYLFHSSATGDKGVRLDANSFLEAETGGVIASSTAQLGTGWHHVAVIWKDNFNVQFYLDGSPWEETAAGSSTSGNGVARFMSEEFDTDNLAGWVDDCLVYARELSDADVALLHSLGRHGLFAKDGVNLILPFTMGGPAAEPDLADPESVDWDNPLTNHPLNQDLQDWWVTVPNRFGYEESSNQGAIWTQPISNSSARFNQITGVRHRTDSSAGRFGYSNTGNTNNEKWEQAPLGLYNDVGQSITFACWYRNDGTKRPGTNRYLWTMRSATRHQCLLDSSDELFLTCSNGSSWTSFRTGVLTLDDQWHHVAVACNANNNGTQFAWHDGVPLTLTGTPTDGGLGWMLFMGGRNSNTLWAGDADDFRVYHRVLTTQEVNDLMAETTNYYANLLNRKAGENTVNRGARSFFVQPRTPGKFSIITTPGESTFRAAEPVTSKPTVGTLPNPEHPRMQGMQGLYLCNEGAGNTLNDVSGQGRHVNRIGGGSWTWAQYFGQWYPRLNFGYGNWNGGTYLDFSDGVTIEVWARSGSVANGVPFGIQSTGNNYFMLPFRDSSGAAVETHARWSSSQVARVNHDYSSWTQLVGTALGSTTQRLFVNGVYRTQNTTSWGGLIDARYVNFGAYNQHATPAWTFGGDVFMARVWDRILSDAEIAELYSDPYAEFLGEDVGFNFPSVTRPFFIGESAGPPTGSGSGQIAGVESSGTGAHAVGHLGDGIGDVTAIQSSGLGNLNKDLQGSGSGDVSAVESSGTGTKGNALSGSGGGQVAGIEATGAGIKSIDINGSGSGTLSSIQSSGQGNLNKDLQASGGGTITSVESTGVGTKEDVNLGGGWGWTASVQSSGQGRISMPKTGSGSGQIAPIGSSGYGGPAERATLGMDTRTFLLRYPDLVAIVGTRIHNSQVPQGWRGPFIWFQRRSSDPDTERCLLDDPTKYAFRESLDVELVGANLEESERLAERLNVIDGFPGGSYGNGRCQAVFLRDAAADYVNKSIDSDQGFHITAYELEVVGYEQIPFF